MMETPRECVRRAMEFRNPSRIPLCLDFDQDELTLPIVSDILRDFKPDILTISSRDPEFVPAEEGCDEMGYKMSTFGETMGEVLYPPIAEWEQFDSWKSHLPDYTLSRRFAASKRLREENPDRFVVGGLGMMMENLLNLRGYANCMVDYYEEEENMNRLIDTLYEIGYHQVDGYAAAGMDAVMAWEDWGLQTGPMISYSMWEHFFHDRMKAFIEYVHSKGMKYILHSCGHITYLMDKFVEFGVDVIQMDQQMNMGTELLSKWKGQICFYCPIDIQHSVNMSAREQEDYARKLIEDLSTPRGGFLYKAYGQPAAIHMPAAQLRHEIECFQNFDLRASF